MTPKIVILPAKKLIGHSISMSLAENKTQEVWKKFMPKLKEITTATSADLFSLQQYPENYFTSFSPFTQFIKWACIEVKNYDCIPEGFEKLELTGGKYAVFIHKGNTEMFAKTAQFIYAEWSPNSGFTLDNRPHFEVLSNAYLGHEHPESEEEVWVPIV